MQNDISQENVSENTALEEIKPAEIKDGQLILNENHKKLIKERIAPNATPGELQLFFMMAYRTRLDPLLQQLYFIKYGQGEKARVSYVTSIDGYRIIAHRTGQFAGIDEPKYQFDKSGVLLSCTVTVYRKDCERGFSATVYFKEYNTGINLWAKMPMTMIAKVAEAHALRKAFPQDLSGVYTTEEMDQAQNQIIDVKISPSKINYILKLLASKGKSVDIINKYYKIKDIKDLSQRHVDDLIRRIETLPDISKESVESKDNEKVDLEDIPDDLDNEVEIMATKGQITLLTAVVKKRAVETNKDYNEVLIKLLSLYEVSKPEELNQNQIKELTNKIVDLNIKDKDKSLIEDVSEVFGGGQQL